MLFTPGVFLSGLADKLKYLDPGSGSILIQLLIAAAAGLGIALAASWKRIKRLFSKNKNTPPAEEPEDEDED